MLNLGEAKYLRNMQMYTNVQLQLGLCLQNQRSKADISGKLAFLPHLSMFSCPCNSGCRTNDQRADYTVTSLFSTWFEAKCDNISLFYSSQSCFSNGTTGTNLWLTLDEEIDWIG